MDRQIRRLGVGLLVLLVVLLAGVNYVQVFAAEDIADNPANAFRQIVAESSVDRGRILASDAETELAFSRQTNGEFEYQRHYPDGPLWAHMTGYYSLFFGRTELEQSFNEHLSGDAPELLSQTLGDLVLGRPKRGASIITSLDPELQELAMDIVEDDAEMREGGAIVVLEPDTGNVLASASNPTFDPNALSTQDPETAEREITALNDDPEQPLLSRASDTLFPPGSVFKIVTAAAALENGDTRSTTYPNPPELELELTDNTLQNFGESHCAGGAARITLADAFQQSCNVTFGHIASELGPRRMARQAEAFGFCLWNPTTSGRCLTDTVPFDIPYTAGRFPNEEYFAQNDPLVAFSGIGQADVATNPLSMAMVAGAVANDGVLMRPRLVTEVRDPQGRVVTSFDPEEASIATSPETAANLTEMMVSVVEGGTGSAAAIANVSVAGKTGTAQRGPGDLPHAWFVAFAPADDPQVAVAVIVLDGGDIGSEITGGQASAPIARTMIEAALDG
ncbi:MAG: penicillin-binding protein 2 [Actinomycetota bacterium]